MAQFTAGPPPWWLKWMNRAIIGMQRFGKSIGTMHVLTVRGRTSGKPRSTPVSPLTVDGERYVIGGYARGDWVRNVRAADGRARLAYGRRTEEVRFVEVPAEQRRPVMRAFPTEVPHGVEFFVKAGVVDEPTPDGFEAAADRVAVFRIDPV